MRLFCIGHKAPLITPNLLYTHISPVVIAGTSQLIIPDDKFGARFHGSILSEYTQLLGLAEFLKDAPAFEKIYIFQYRKFISFRPGLQLSINQPYSYASPPNEGVELFPRPDEFLTLGDALLLGPAIKIRSIAHHYAQFHLVEDFSKFIFSLKSLNKFTGKRCEEFINCDLLLPAPSLGVIRVDIFLRHMQILRAVWENFSSNFSINHRGYQRRLGGFLLERLHSFLLYEEVSINQTIQAHHGYQIVISDSPSIAQTI